MKIQRTPSFICAFTAIVLELLPYGAVMRFANPEGDAFRRTYSYFSLLPFGYANFGPLLTAILTSALAVLSLIFIFRDATGIRVAVLTVSALSAVTSSLPLLMFGIGYFSAIGFAVTLLLTVTFLFALPGVTK
ncbi:MAG: hypothetical protein IKV54_06370 [Clostridia bacterium]|nr:hypothetical protein [Clostridia bacterium]